MIHCINYRMSLFAPHFMHQVKMKFLTEKYLRNLHNFRQNSMKWYLSSFQTDKPCLWIASCHLATSAFTNWRYHYPVKIFFIRSVTFLFLKTVSAIRKTTVLYENKCSALLMSPFRHLNQCQCLWWCFPRSWQNLMQAWISSRSFGDICW